MLTSKIGRRWALALAMIVAPAVAPAQEAGPNSRAEAIRRAAAKVGPSVAAIRAVRNPMRDIAGPSGAGVVVDAGRGLVATTGRALFGGFRAEVVLSDGEPRPVLRVFHADPAGELLLLQVDPATPGLVAAELGDSTRLQLGDDLFAIGRSPEGRILATAGIVASSRDRDDPGSELASFPIDAMVAVENAGGPVLDREGLTVGVAVPIEGPFVLGRPRGSFTTAIPSARIRAAIADFDEGGGPPRSYLGVLLGPDRPLPAARGLDAPGALVIGVAKESPAERILLRPGDRITAVDGRDVPDSQAFQRAIDRRPVGDEVTLTVVRGDETLSIKVRTVPRPGAFLPSPRPPGPPSPAESDEPNAESTPKNGRNEGTDLPKPLP
ncbi:S1C family serine protease [Paludisphaera soli]|uniref:S1C family serine protease n=1 Tax=Paludisphaera soli TaxID=2712865 RepID=UPI0013ECF619|nr:PDZ domain-containing protein [Paludisphaera soli]